MQKSYIVDTNILIEDSKCIDILRNGEENKIYLTRTVIEELDKLKDKKPHLKSRIFNIVAEIDKHKDDIEFLYCENEREIYSNKDNKIIDEILWNINRLQNPILITNDKLLRFKAYKKGIITEEYKRLIPHQEISEEYTGFIKDGETLVENCFLWKEGKPVFWSSLTGEKPITYQNMPWKINPINVYQNCFIDLIMNDNIDLVTVQSSPGKGKTYVALATALFLLFQKKTYDKIYIVKTNYEIGNELGFLPGDVLEKIFPYFIPVKELLMKLHNYRNFPQKAFDEKNIFGFNKDLIEFMPINYLRGRDLENSIVIVEEIQNLSRADARSLLSRMGKNIKCICTGDISQIDNPYVDKYNNAMNWIVQLFSGESNYAHIVLKGKQSRGPICQLVIDKEL